MSLERDARPMDAAAMRRALREAMMEPPLLSPTIEASEELVRHGKEVATVGSKLSQETGKEKPIYLDENVQFTIYRPKKIRPERWYTLLAFAHLSERPPDADEDEPDPIEVMEKEAGRILADERPEDYGRATQDSSHSIPRQSEISFVPFIEGVEFNPPSASFIWQESVHSQKFRMRASPLLDGKVARGSLSIYLGAILLAEINLRIRVTSEHALDDRRTPKEVAETARPYRKIFPSYSHEDLEIVAQIEHYAQAVGDRYMRDVHELRSGQNWKEWMKDAIGQADIFQLFWSTNSMRSQNVRLEWEYALRLHRPNFIRPTYWENPLPQSPAENLPPPELRDLHFQHVRPHATMHFPPSGGWPDKVITGELPPSMATGREPEEEVEYYVPPGSGPLNEMAASARDEEVSRISPMPQPSPSAVPPPKMPATYKNMPASMPPSPAQMPMKGAMTSRATVALLGLLLLLALIGGAFFVARWLDIL
ncbi:MAG: toll/interleukin-1 receptor domain-containing protein [Pyrinomonadaceae bacterium]|nr:toll/interleukin-1 receptor domain-containing protein [Pyrinomonadaceae bacterium]